MELQVANAYRTAGGDQRLSNEAVIGLWLRGRHAWPNVPAEPARFGRLAASRIDLSADDLAEAAADLFVVASCAAGHTAAIAAFEARYFRVIGAALASMRLAADQIDEVTQRVRQRLFLGQGEGAPVERYVGRGDLVGLVRTIAVRVALNLLRDARPAVEILEQDDVARLGDALDDPELLLLRAAQQREVKVAFASALDQLAARERTLLRLQLIDGLSIDELGGLFGVNRATAARWLERARQSVASRTREALQRRLMLDDEQLDALLAVVRSRLDLSLSRLLAASRI